MRVLHVINTLKTGGAENLLTQLAPALRAKGVEVEVALFVELNTEFEKQLKTQNIKIHSFFKSGSSYNFFSIPRLRKLLPQFDLIHSHNTSPQFFTRIANLGIKKPLITTEHGGSNRRRNSNLFKVLDNWMYRGYKKIVCISSKTESAFRDYYGDNDKILTINNGIDVPKFNKAKPSDDILALKQNGEKLLAMVAGFRWEKDQPTVIKSLHFLPSNFHLLLVGDGYRKTEFKDLVRNEGLESRVHFLGLRNDIPKILKACDYVILSSKFEGLSLSSLEGMAAKKPVIASDVDGLREVVKGSGILFEEGNSKALADSVLKLDNDTSLYSAVSNKCYESSLKYSIKSTVNNYYALYCSLLNEPFTTK